MKKILLSLMFAGGAFMATAQTSVEVLYPSSIAQAFQHNFAMWPLTPNMGDPANKVIAPIIIARDNGGVSGGDSLMCSTTSQDLTGKIAVLWRGTCAFGLKAKNAWDAGAVGVIIINNVDGGGVQGMTSSPEGDLVTVPVVMISKEDGAILRTALVAGDSVSVLLGNKGDYCSPIYNDACSSGMQIEDFKLVGENGTSIEEYGTGCLGGYDDRTAISSVELYPNSVYSVNVTSAAPYAQGVTVWIDFNDNGVFESTENVGSTTNVVAAGTFPISIPAGATVGTHRMRVMLAYNYYDGVTTASITDPCTPTNANDNGMSFGETHDYTVIIAAQPTCSGSYNAGQVSAVATICPGYDFTLSTNANLPNLIGLTGTWQASTNGGANWNDIATTIAGTYNLVGGISQNTDFRFVATCLSGTPEVSNIISVSVNTNPAECPCLPVYTANSCAYGMFINDFVLTGENGTAISDIGTGCSTNDYDDRTAQSVELYTNSTYSANITSNATYAQGATVWIDFNDNGVFESTENVGFTTDVVSAGTFPISIPAGATVGSHRMRVMLAYNYGDGVSLAPITDACSPPLNAGSSYGETHDYTVIIAAKPDCAGTPSAGTIASSVATICPSIDFDLATDVVFPNVNGLTGQWQAFDGTNWNDIASANAVDYTVAGGISQNTDYRFIATCSVSNQADTSNIVSVTMKNYTECYCEPVYTNGCIEVMTGEAFVIDDFKLIGENGTSIDDQATGCSTGSYDDRTAETVELYENSTYSVDVTSTAPYTQGVTAWIDFNDNGIFESSEKVGSTINLINDGNTFPISIPFGATTGNHRMRVMLAYNHSNAYPIDDPCLPPYVSEVGGFSYGETHDYTVNILCNPNFVVNLGADDAYCVGTAYTKTLDAGTFTDVTYTWSDGSTNQTLVADTAGTYSVVVALSNGCTAKDTVVITENALPVVNLGLDTAICTGSTLTLDAQNTGATFTWSDNSTAQTFAVTTAGTYNVTVEDANGCIGTDAINVSINALPVVNLGLDTVICAGNTVTLNAQNTGATFTWSDNSSAQTLAVTATGEYSVIVENANGCIGKDTIVVTINALPIVNLGLDTAICTGSTLTLDAQNTGSTFTWSDNSTVQTLAVTTTGTYSVIVTNASGCIAKDTVEVSVNVLPVVNLGADAVLCMGSTITLNAGNTGSTYVWSDGSTNQTLVVTTAGTYDVTVTDGNGCVGSDTVTITDNSGSTATLVDLGADDAYCAGTTYSKMLDAGTAVSYQWSPGGETTQTLTVTTAGTYSVTITDANGCSSSDVIVITENALPVVNLGLDTAICTGSTLTLDAQNTGSTFTWSDNSTAQTFAVTTAGTYNVMVEDANGCIGTDAINVSINTLPVVNLGLDTAICVGATLTLDAQNAGATFLWSDNSTNQTLAVTSAGTYSVTVTNANGCSATDDIVVTENTLPVVDLGLDTAICAGATLTLDAQNAGSTYLWSDGSTAQTLAVTTADTYSVTVTNANGCSSSDDIVVTENTLPVVNLGADTAICAGATLTLDAENAGATFLWSNSSTTQTLAVTSAGTYSVTVTNVNGCIAKDTVVVTTNPLPTAGSLSATNDVCAFDFGVTGVTGATSYEWNFGDNNTATTTTAFTSHEYENEGTYTVTVKVKNACGEVEKQVEVTCNEVSVKDVANANRIAMYPNPTSSVVTLDASVEMTEITVVDNLGKVVYRVSPNHTMSYQMNVSELSNGFYTVIITTNSGVVTKKLEVTK